MIHQQNRENRILKRGPQIATEGLSIIAQHFTVTVDRNFHSGNPVVKERCM